MDLSSLVVSVLFGILFISAVVGYVRRRDALSRDVMLIFGTVAMLFVVVGARVVIGSLPAWVDGAALALLFAQPLLTLRLANKLHPVHRPVRLAATVAYLATALPLIVFPLKAVVVLVLAAIAVFVVTDLVASFYLAREARRRVGSARVRLGAAAAASALMALAVLVSTIVSSIPAIGTVGADIGRFLGLAAASLYVVAFMPPRWLRNIWGAVASFDFEQDLMGVAADPSDAAVWQRLADASRRATGSTATLVVTGELGSALVVASSAEGSGRDQVAATRFDSVPTASDEHRPTREGSLADQAHAIGAPFVSVLPFTLAGGEPGALLLLRARPSLFASDDHAMLRSLVGRAAIFAERSRAVTEQAALAQRLAQTVAALEQASQAKSDFLASMSHELRTPLSAIIGFSALMRDEPLADDRRSVPDEWIEHVHRSGDHLLALINDVLDLTKIEAGRINLELEAFGLGTALGESVEGLRPLAQRKSIEMVLDCEDGMINADRGRLRQMVYNLLSNAIKFTPDGGHIGVEGRWVGDEARITVRDTGVGIEPNDLEHIFEEFRQVGDLKARQAGTGLGLALCRRLAEAHGGRLEVTSEIGRGSRFTVVLPGTRAESSDRPSPPPPIAVEVTGPSILIIEDDPGAVRLLRAYLEAEGYNVEVATDGETGIAAAQTNPPDAIILDVLLPGIDGWEVLRRLKGDPALRDLPVVVVTVVDERNVAMNLGAVDYFLKPVRREALLARLSQYTFTTKVKVGRVRVLAIDDDPAARELVANALRPEGFDVVSAASGREGLDLALEDPPDLVICDLLMPDMDGYEVVERLHANESTKDVTILILTGQDLSAADRERLNGKVAEVVRKGVDPRPAFARWLRRASAAARRRSAEALTS
ncbi:MAG TPA: response regulator [Candidatus Limnocylindria bacterium]|jgi:signal transduction histidine kinase/DNA-binding response OmpR family regulator